MPFIPFIGISVLFHLCVIAWCKAFPNQSQRRVAILPPAFTLAAGYVIIVFIFSFVAVGASSIVMLSLEESHSSLPAAESAFTASVAFFAPGHAFAVTNGSCNAKAGAGILPPLDLSTLREAGAQGALLKQFIRTLQVEPTVAGT